jgi:hypothetical protein
MSLSLPFYHEKEMRGGLRPFHDSPAAEAGIDRYFTMTDWDIEFEQPQASFTVSCTL